MALVISINGGSSSIRFACHDISDLCNVASGKLERIGTPRASLTVEANDGARPTSAAHPTDGAASGRRTSTVAADAPDLRSAARFLLGQIEATLDFSEVCAVGHRVVHGLDRREPERVTTELLADLRKLQSLDPDHLPGELDLLEVIAEAYPELPQVVCFDTAFHQHIPRHAYLLAIPRRYARQGVRRYGFHGLSYTYLLSALRKLGDPAADRGRVILAHLGSGASMAAVRDGCGIDTTMGFTPVAGLMMGTRSGDLDPGLVGYLASSEGMTGAEFHTLVNKESGLLGVSETSADIRDLLSRETEDERAADAVAMFCYQACKSIGALAAALGGLDTLVFAGGIGEHAATVRGRICDPLRFLGIDLDPERNAQHAAVISRESRPVTVRVIATDEEVVIASSIIQLLNLNSENIP